MIKKVLNRLMDECRIEMGKLKNQEINEETVEAFIFLNRQLNYMRNLLDKLNKEEIKDDSNIK